MLTARSVTIGRYARVQYGEFHGYLTWIVLSYPKIDEVNLL